MAHLFSDVGGSATTYSMDRRQRARQQLQGFNGPVEEIVGAEVAASSSSNGAMRAIGIGVATGVLTLIVNRLIERAFFGK